MKLSLWDVLAFLVLCLMGGVVWLFLQIFFNPAHPLNPFPPPTQPAVYAFPTATATLLRLPPTWTPGIQPVQSGETALRPTSTVPATSTPLLMNTFTATATPTPTPTSTATPTSTSTITRTPTITLTRTITLTSTQTPDYAATSLSQFATDAALTQQAGGGTP